MVAPPDFIAELPTGDVDLGGDNYVRVYGFADITPPLVEMRIVHRGEPIALHFLPAQAKSLCIALLKAINKAQSDT